MNLARKRILFLPTALLLLVVGPSSPPRNSVAAPGQQAQRARSGTYGPPRILAELREPEIDESSGLVASSSAGVYWTHNDSGDGPFLYAIDEAGSLRGIWRVTGAGALDWEDIAAGPGPQRDKRYLYIGDIGDNDSNRSEVVVYRIPEPAVNAAAAGSTKKQPRVTEAAEAIRLRYPDGSHDAETLLVHPVTGDLYIITKILLARPVVYKASAPLATTGANSLVRLAELSVPSILGGILTGGDISPNGRRVALCDYLQGYELILPPESRSFDDIWKQRMSTIDLGTRKQGEAIAYRLDGRALLATSEGKRSPLIQVVRR
jgi:hypothetical protein